jgi:DNA-binding response OmpR family regulator
MVKEEKTILFLEDELQLLSTVGNLLLEQGYNVIKVTNAEEALRSIQSSAPDLILADIKLPGMDGFDFFNEVRKYRALDKVPVVFLTAFNDVNAMMYAKKVGVSEYITKPFDFEYLVARIRDLVPLL